MEELASFLGKQSCEIEKSTKGGRWGEIYGNDMKLCCLSFALSLLFATATVITETKILCDEKQFSYFC
jgi:hypothetical protein